MEATKDWDVGMSGECTEPFGLMVWTTKSVYDKNGKVNETAYLSDSGAALSAHSNQDTMHCAAFMVADRYWEEEGKSLRSNAEEHQQSMTTKRKL